jgi:hypothetical protein
MTYKIYFRESKGIIKNGKFVNSEGFIDDVCFEPVNSKWTGVEFWLKPVITDFEVYKDWWLNLILKTWPDTKLVDDILFVPMYPNMKNTLGILTLARYLVERQYRVSFFRNAKYLFDTYPDKDPIMLFSLCHFGANPENYGHCFFTSYAYDGTNYLYPGIVINSENFKKIEGLSDFPTGKVIKKSKKLNNKELIELYENKETK